MTIYYVTTQRATLLVQAGDGPTLIVNRDPTNNLLVGPTPAVGTAGQQDLSIIDPLGSRTVGGLVDVWGIAQGATVATDVQNDAVSWSPSPAQIAAQIQASGIFINTNSTEIANIPNTSVPSNTITAVQTVNFNQIGYEIRIVSKWNGAPEPVDDFFTGVQLDWLDTTTGQIVATDRWFMGASKSTSAQLITAGSGPTKGNQVKISFINNDLTGAAVTISCVLLTNSRTYLKDDWRWMQPNGVTFNAYASPIVVNGSNILSINSFNQAANTLIRYPIGLWAGRVSLAWMEGIQGWTGGQPTVTWAINLLGVNDGNQKIPLREPDGVMEFVSGRFPAAIEVNNLNPSSVTTSFFTAIGLD